MFRGTKINFVEKFELKIKSWNINGFNSALFGNKLLDNEFLDEVTSFDIVSLVETHAYGKDLYLPGYKPPFRRDRPIIKKVSEIFWWYCRIS